MRIPSMIVAFVFTVVAFAQQPPTTEWLVMPTTRQAAQAERH
jgi:hypothetical protein